MTDLGRIILCAAVGGLLGGVAVGVMGVLFGAALGIWYGWEE